jgi:hypothetical protein
VPGALAQQDARVLTRDELVLEQDAPVPEWDEGMRYALAHDCSNPPDVSWRRRQAGHD